MKKNLEQLLAERFGDPIGSYAGVSAAGVHDTEKMHDESVCQACGLMPVGGKCGCSESEVCSSCGMMPFSLDASACECGMNEAKKGPSKKTAKKILRGTKTFKQKMKKVEKWADDPASAAAWMTHKATGKWPSEK